MRNKWKTKCEEIGFKHCWEDITEPVVTLGDVYPIPEPVKKERCVNCGLVRKLKVVKEWIYEN